MVIKCKKKEKKGFNCFSTERNERGRFERKKESSLWEAVDFVSDSIPLRCNRPLIFLNLKFLSWECHEGKIARMVPHNLKAVYISPKHFQKKKMIFFFKKSVWPIINKLWEKAFFKHRNELLGKFTIKQNKRWVYPHFIVYQYIYYLSFTYN